MIDQIYYYLIMDLNVNIYKVIRDRFFAIAYNL